ncbi:type I phosphomannose isomerase catalytic subunit [Exiguobacterium sp. SL-9]|uniref:type I phosphomannose isomerase catalytic subunit n=1 Tax=Exiguobacterium sp. SL-9 TaxID=2510963 RepID=UPI00103C257D|nr:type I phosphomannose isomerase catalytic subunit [Exiguobacterium sp. SL-9]TCI21398.1 class I mannose-6-phosphate isomerase [Exiguobacterium sp. SL-9]
MYKLKPVFKHRIWGGRQLETLFDFELPPGDIGECWGVSAHPNGMTVFEDGPYIGQTLAHLWETERLALFGHYPFETFPLHIKLLDARSYLSVQVHPNDEQAQKLEQEEFGKDECWYIVDAEPGAEIIIGHTFRMRQEVYTCVDNKEWATRLKKRSVKKGDFIYIPSGTVHALGPGIVLLEIQQTSDRTYRLYDFERTDDAGMLRELHIDKAIEVMTIPELQTRDLIQTNLPAERMTELISKPAFTIRRYQVDGASFALEQSETFQLLSVLSGHGYVHSKEGGRKIQAGEHYFIPKGKGPHSITGQVEVITSEIPVPTTHRVTTVYPAGVAQRKRHQVSASPNVAPQ